MGVAWCYQVEITQESIAARGTEGILMKLGVAWWYQVEITQEAIATRSTEGIPMEVGCGLVLQGCDYLGGYHRSWHRGDTSEVGVAWYSSDKIPRCIIVTLPPRL